jgi:hypothetical protein
MREVYGCFWIQIAPRVAYAQRVGRGQAGREKRIANAIPIGVWSSQGREGMTAFNRRSDPMGIDV